MRRVSTVATPPPASDVLAAFRAADSDPDPFNGLIGTERYFNAACDAGEVAPLTLDRDDLALAPADTASRIAAVRDRLRRLGYPLADVAAELRGVWAADVLAALARFQKEASLTECVGELTVASWDALQELFNFETPLNVEAWFTASAEPEAALLRAVRLRLSVLGFGGPPMSDDFTPSSKAMTGFAETAFTLGVMAEALPGALTPAFAAVLFAHDALADRLADCLPRLAALNRREQARAENFLVCFAKIELWLHGYDVAPDGSSKLIQPAMAGRHGGGRLDRPNVTANQFNLFFAELAPEGISVKSASPGAIPQRVPELLARMRELRATQPLPKATASRELVALLEAELEKSPGLWTQLREAAAKLVGVLFDGVRRVIAWLGRLLRRVWSTVSTAAVNLWRAVHHFMGAAAFYFRKAARALAEGVSFLLSPGHASEPCGHSAYCRRIDFDAALVLDDDSDERVVKRFTRGLLHKSSALAIACRIIRLVKTAVRLALSGVAGALGGFVPMMLGLASVYSQLRELGRLLDALPAED